MGTFHDDKGELHGITVVVDTTGSRVFIGRCDTMTDAGIVLLDADEHDSTTGTSKEDYVKKAARVGIWKKHDRVALTRDEFTTVKPLGEFTA
jgi:hypothetical protein